MSAETEQISARLSEETGQLNARLMATDAKAEAAHTAAKLADNRAQQAADTATKSIQVSHQKLLKELEAAMEQISSAQESLSQQAAAGQADTEGPSSLPKPMADTFENSIFFGGVPAFRDRLGLHPKSDPIFVMSWLLRDMGIYAGMDSIVLADNAAKSRLEVRVVIIHMHSQEGGNGHLTQRASQSAATRHYSEGLFPHHQDGQSQEAQQSWHGTQEYRKDHQIPDD